MIRTLKISVHSLEGVACPPPPHASLNNERLARASILADTAVPTFLLRILHHADKRGRQFTISKRRGMLRLRKDAQDRQPLFRHPLPKVHACLAVNTPPNFQCFLSRSVSRAMSTACFQAVEKHTRAAESSSSTAFASCFQWLVLATQRPAAEF